MAIAIRCPHCGKAYSLKDELKGKRVACTNPNCKKVFTVDAPASLAASCGAPTAAPAKPAPGPANVDELAAALFAETKAEEVKPEAVTATATATIRVKCQHCDHENIFDAKMAGKNAPCQNEECRKIIKVPLPVKADPKDWR